MRLGQFCVAGFRYGLGVRSFWRLTFKIERLHRGEEAVPATWKGFDEARIRGAVPKSIAELVDSGVEAVIEIDERVGWPEPLAEFFASHNVPGTFEQRGQNPERLFLNPKLPTFTR